MPVITLIGLSLPAVLSGAVVVESVFNYPGMGLLFWNAATTHDYPVLLGFTVVDRRRHRARLAAGRSSLCGRRSAGAIRMTGSQHGVVSWR